MGTSAWSFCAALPAEARACFRSVGERGKALHRDWDQRFAAYARAYPELAQEIERRFSAELPAGWDESLPRWPADARGMATRKASEAVLQALAKAVPELVGGSGDLDPSTFTWLKEGGDLESPARQREGVDGTVGGG
ncbi:hypothetical protein WME76_35255 [Sorangium sp. So ce119]|uniref:hypothetical protein n=1 Tax=Sorangium sp. So ce119 TaxID=3133279 RepID=UPI003F605E0F